MSPEQPDYLAYLVRLWRVNDVEDVVQEPTWRVSIENPHTGERQGFASLEELFDFLREQAGGESKTSLRKGEQGKFSCQLFPQQYVV